MDGGLEESFQCAPGPGGWRYVGERADGLRVDLAVDSRWRQIRVEIRSGGWAVRGGLAGRELIWVRQSLDGTGAVEHSTMAWGFLSESPGFLVAVARSLGLAPGEDKTIRLVRLNGPSLAPLTVDQRWRLTGIESHETDTRPLPVERYEITDLSTGETHTIHLAGDVILGAPALELTQLTSPPNL